MKREELLPLLDERIGKLPGRPWEMSGDLYELILNQRAIMQALSYLIEHQTEQAWISNPAPPAAEDDTPKPF